MPLSLEEVRRIAMLARLEVSEHEAAAVRDQLNDIFGLIEQLQAVDTQGIEPMSHAGNNTLRLREDRVGDNGARERFQTLAPQVEQALYLVPKVIE
jgi:aspartyl-tRNA(Asn)/glutamyl-tRNA(Gln) amidotransferase subunit C